MLVKHDVWPCPTAGHPDLYYLAFSDAAPFVTLPAVVLQTGPVIRFNGCVVFHLCARTFNGLRRFVSRLTPSLPQPVKFPGWKVHTYTPPNSIFDGPITNLLWILSIFIEICSCAHAKRGQSLNGFRFGSFIGRFPSDCAASMAVKVFQSEQKRTEEASRGCYGQNLNK